MIHKLR